MKTKVSVSIFFFFMLISPSLSAQKIKLAEKNILDKANIICTYKYSYIQDIDNPALITENIMILEIGKSVSKFYDYQHYRLDSVMIAEYNTTIFEENKKKYTQMIRNANKIQIYKNYPEGKITIIDRIPFDNYKYEEPLIYPKWELKNEKKLFMDIIV